MLESCQFQNSLSHQLVNFGAVGVEAFAHQDGNIAPPLGTLALWTVIEGVSHVHVECAQTFQPEAIEIIVIASERSLWQTIIACLAIHNLLHFHALRYNHIKEISIHPSQALIGLLA